MGSFEDLIDFFQSQILYELVIPDPEPNEWFWKVIDVNLPFDVDLSINYSAKEYALYDIHEYFNVLLLKGD